MYCNVCGKDIPESSVVCVHCGSPTSNFYNNANPLKQVNRDIKARNKEKQKIHDNGSFVCQKCGGTFHDGAHKCPRCGAHVAYVGGSFFDNWPLLLAACFVSVVPYLLSVGLTGAAVLIMALGVVAIIARFYIPRIRAKGKMIVRRKLDFQIWMLTFLIPALTLAYSLADIKIAYK